jgi:hypothetical protein
VLRTCGQGTDRPATGGTPAEGSVALRNPGRDDVGCRWHWMSLSGFGRRRQSRCPNVLVSVRESRLTGLTGLRSSHAEPSVAHACLRPPSTVVRVESSVPSVPQPRTPRRALGRPKRDLRGSTPHQSFSPVLSPATKHQFKALTGKSTGLTGPRVAVMSYPRTTTASCMRTRMHTRLITITRRFSPVSPVTIENTALTCTLLDGTERD